MTRRIRPGLSLTLLLLAVLLAFAVSAAAEPVMAGGCVRFGACPQTAGGGDSTPIEWLVLEVEEGRALLLSRYGLDAAAFHEPYGLASWETSSLRAWLNGTFYENAFSEAEKGAILETEVENTAGQGYDWAGEYAWAQPAAAVESTKDRVFLLSYAEAWRYLGSSRERMCVPTDYAVSRGAWTAGTYQIDGKPTGWWWLRSPGIIERSAAIVRNTGSLYSYSVNDACVSVRPAIWVDLNIAGF